MFFDDIPGDLFDEDPKASVIASGAKAVGRALGVMVSDGAMPSGFQDPRMQERPLETPAIDPIDLVGGAVGAKLGKAFVRDAGSILGNELGSVGANVKEAADAKAKTLMAQYAEEQRLARAGKSGFDTNTTYYHGTRGGDIKAFDPNKTDSAKGQIAGFFSKNSDFANDYATQATSKSGGANVVPVHLNVKKTFDYANPDDLDNLFDKLSSKQMKEILSTHKITVDDLEKGLEKGDWSYLENPQIIDTIKKLGYDSVHVQENGVKNIAVFNPENIRSKFAQFDPSKASSGNISAAVGGVSAAGGAAKLMFDDLQDEGGL
jgi:hypothetical protein